MFATSAVQVLNEYHGVTVTLRRGPLTSDEMTARREMRKSPVLGQDLDGFGIEVATDVRSYRLPRAACVLDGILLKPRTGDEVVEGDDVFTIGPPDDKTSAVRAIDGSDWIVHTKQTK